MKTKIFSKKNIKEAAELIRKGEVVAFPTETVYGLGANALKENAVKKIFKAKGRPTDNPLIMHIANRNDIHKYCENVSMNTKNLIKQLWPGPVTIILKKKKIIPNITSANLDTIGVRMPNNNIALDLIKHAKVPIAAPSANISTKPSGTNFESVYEDFNLKVAGIIKSSSSEIGLESTVIDLTTNPPVLLRPGGISFEKLKKFLPTLILSSKKVSISPKSPGMKYKHYSPKAKIILFPTNSNKQIVSYKLKLEKQHKNVIVIHPKNNKEFSKKMFKLFRDADKNNIDYILMSSIDETGLGLAIMNRIEKASTKIMK